MSDRGAFLDYWKNARSRTKRVIAVIPPEQLEWSPGPGRWTFGDMIRHLGGIERGMYAETAAMRESRYPGHGPAIATGYADVVAYLDRCHLESMEIFEAVTVAQWESRVMTPAGAPITLWKWLRAMVEHEAHHRGQMYLMLGLIGVKTPPLYGLTEEEVLARSAQ
jgi:uncharacterized damage-inducible protein DinB